MAEEKKADNLPDRKELEETIGALQSVHKAQGMARELKAKASKASSPAERERLFKEAYAKEVEAHGHSKVARRMQSGTWQGLFGGGGIGAGVGMGLGAVLGTLLGGLLSIPTIALGGLVGSGVGAVHGPWIKVGDIQKRFEDATPKEVVDALEEERRGGQGGPSGEETVGKGQQDGGTESAEHTRNDALPIERRKPRKIEIRSKNGPESKTSTIEDLPS